MPYVKLWPFLGFMLSKEVAVTLGKKVDSIKILPKKPNYYSDKVKYPSLSAGAAET